MTTVVRMLVLMSVAACASGPPGADESRTPPPISQPSLRLIGVEPPAGAAIDSTSILRATLAWRLPPAGDTLRYFITPLFGVRRGFSSSGFHEIAVKGDAGTVEVDYPLAPLLAGAGTPPRVTGAFALFKVPQPMSSDIDEDTLKVVPGRTRLRRALVATRPLARTRAVFYGQGGPATSPPGRPSLDGWVEEFLTYYGHRALAVAVDSSGTWTVGYAWGWNEPDSAITTAMRHCIDGRKRRSLSGRCEVIAFDDRVLQPGAAPPEHDLTHALDVPERVIRATEVRGTTAVLVDSVSVDLDGDGELERIDLRAASTPRAAAFVWQLAVRKRDAGFLLAEHVLPDDAMSFAVTPARSEGKPMVLLSRGNGTCGIETFIWDSEQQAFTARSLEMEPRLERARAAR